MTSSINPNNIDGGYPIAGQDNNSQGFRDNFTETKVNFQYAATEITDLQTKAVLKAALSGTTLDNNMADNLLYAAKIQDFSATRVAITPVSGTLTLNYASAHYQTYDTATAGSVSLAFNNFPASGSYGLVRLQLTVSSVAHTLTLPIAVSVGITGIQGIAPGTAGVTNTITFSATGVFEFAFGTYDGGSAITIFDLNRPLTNYGGSSLAVGNISASGTANVTGNVNGGNLRTAGLISATGTVSATGNIQGGNVISLGIGSATGNLIGGNVLTAGLVSAAGNVTGFITPAAGTATVAPLDFVSGTLNTTALAGALEYDGVVLYGTPQGSQRGVLGTTHFMCLTVDYTGNDSATAQKVFNVGTGAAGAITLPATTSYFMEAVYYITRSVGTTSHNFSTLFALGGTLTSIGYTVDTTSTTGNTLGAVSRIYATAATAVVCTAASTSATENITVVIRGVLRTNTAGTFTPQFKYDTAPGGAPSILKNSYIKLTPMGTNSVTSVGNW